MNNVDNMKHLIQLIESAEHLDEIDFKKAAATAMAVGALAGGVNADPGAIPGTEPEANPEYNAPAVDRGYVKQHIDQNRAEVLAYKIISGMGYDTDFTGKNSKGYKAFVQDVSNWGVTVKVYYKGTLGFQSTAEVQMSMDLKGRLTDIVVYDNPNAVKGSKIIQDHPIFNKVIGSKISK